MPLFANVQHQNSFNDELYQDRPWKKFFKNEKNPEFYIPKFKTISLLNNAEIKYLSFPKQELLSFVITIKGSESLEDSKTNGITSLWLNVLENSLKEHVINLERHGTQWSLDKKEEWIVLTIRSLKNYFISDLSEILDFLNSPEWNANFLEIEKKNHLRFISELSENPNQLAFILTEKIMWKNHPIRGRKIPRKLDFTIDQINQWHKKQISSNHIFFYMLTDQTEIEPIISLLNSFLKKLPKTYDQSYPEYKHKPITNKEPKPILYHYHKEIPTSVILFAAPGIAHNHPDYYAYKLANHIIGGDSFNSVIPKKIRVENGWAYSSYSFYQSGRTNGSTYIFSQSSYQYTSNVLKEIQNILKDQSYLNEKNIEHAKKTSINRFVFLYRNHYELMMQKIMIAQDDLSENFLSDFTKELKKTETLQIQKSGQKYFSPNIFNVFIVGPASIAKSSYIQKNYQYHQANLKDILE